MNLEEAIVNLLLRHNCVVIPAFGGFVAQSTSAIVDIRSGVMMPPKKSVLFNRQLVNNDGLLLSHFSKQMEIPYSDAEQILKNHVTEWNTKLKEGQRISIDKIGHLYLDAERNISFEQDRFFNLLLQSYGLSKVHFITEEEVKIAEYQHHPARIQAIAPAVVEEKVNVHPVVIAAPIETASKEAPIVELQPEKEAKRKIWRYVAAAALLPFAFYTYWIPMKTNVLESGMISVRDFNPAYHSGQGVYQQKDFVATFENLKSVETDGKDSKLNADVEIAEGKKKAAENLENEVETTKSTPEVTKPTISKPENKAEDEKTIAKPAKETVEKPKVAAKEKVETNVPAKSKNVKPQTPTKEKTTTAKPVANNAKVYHYIVSCFGNMENANALRLELEQKGFKSEIVKSPGGLYGVSAGGTTDPKENQNIANKAKELGYQGWTL